jgi:hypothetical protein
MKKIIILAVAILFMLNVSFAENNPALENNNKVVNELSKTFKYPSSARENLVEGYVVLSFMIDDNGLVQLNQIYSNKAELKDYVQKELNAIVLQDLNPGTGQTYEMKIIFKLE